jgi:hypothetical protein
MSCYELNVERIPKNRLGIGENFTRTWGSLPRPLPRPPQLYKVYHNNIRVAETNQSTLVFLFCIVCLCTLGVLHDCA